MEWISEKKKPKCDRKFGDSDYYLCVNMDGDTTPFVAWYNNKTNKWTVAHHYAESLAASVTHYQKLPEPPKQS
jgi:hypothetical protein